jgi:hypothetical protein
MSKSLPTASPAPFGTADRTDPLAHQARRKGHSRRYSALAAVAAAVLGIPLSVLLTALIYLVLAIVCALTFIYGALFLVQLVVI